MPLDAICLQAVVTETAREAVGMRIDKIQQPARDQVVLQLRHGKRILLCASPNQPRLHMTALIRDNPSQAPMFCMLLRKYLQGGVIVSIAQTPLERVVTLRIDASDELGERCTYSLVLELLSHRANLILCDAQGRIIDCLRRVDLESSQSRQLLPGLFYRLPPPQAKQSPLQVDREAFFTQLSRAQRDLPAERWLVDAFTAVSPLLAREIAYTASGSTDMTVGDGPEQLWNAFSAWQKTVKDECFTPVVIERDGKMMDFYCMPIAQYGTYAACRRMDTFGALMDAFYQLREQQERVRVRGHELLKTASNARDRLRRKLAVQEQEYAKTQERHILRRFGELITANLYRMERGQTRLMAEDYYEEACPRVEIPLDGRLSPQENAARYFKLYTKAKTAEVILAQQLSSGREELRYLESVLQELELAESEQDFLEIRSELESAGYLRVRGKKTLQRPAGPRRFCSTAGLVILVGRNNRQNDRLTGKDAMRNDLWFHTRTIHGSHVILCTGGAQPDEQSMQEAAMLAAWYSQGRQMPKVDVDYTQVRFVKKSAGARPGMVNYVNYKTLTVTPDGSLADRLAVR